VGALRDLAELHDVKLIVPLTDLDHLALAEARDSLGGAVVLVPGVETIARCSDKYLAHVFFEEQGIGSPPTWLATELPDDPRFPLLVKARKGFGSRHIFRADNQAELEFFLRYTTADSMVQCSCLGVEFSIDVFCDLEGRCLAAIPRTMIESKGGESIKGMTIRDDELVAFGVRVSEALRIIGPANVQCFREPDGQLQVTDVNPRFGGGFPLPTAAGSRYPELALALANGEQPEQRLGDFREGVVMTRFFSEVILAEVDGALMPFVDAAPAAPGEA
jgi:carbamoyl-phosphate synthase large subunit